MGAALISVGNLNASTPNGGRRNEWSAYSRVAKQRNSGWEEPYSSYCSSAKSLTRMRGCSATKSWQAISGLLHEKCLSVLLLDALKDKRRMQQQIFIDGSSAADKVRIVVN